MKSIIKEYDKNNDTEGSIILSLYLHINRLMIN